MSRKRRPVEERFWEKVNVTTDCWLWTGSLDHKGYGHMNVDANQVKAHRLAYEILVGPIPDGHVIDHLCRNETCVRPDHLEAVRQVINVRRGKLARFSEEQIEAIKERLRAVESMRVIAADYDVHENTIWHIANGWTWNAEGIFGPGGEIIRPEVHCLECGALITTGQRHKKFCCASHRSAYNNRQRYRRQREATHA